MKRFGFYALRWQLSTPILAPVIIYCNGVFSANASINFWIATVLANFIGASIFFWVDKIIFKPKLKNPLWEIKEPHASNVCVDCGSVGSRVYRLVKAPNYDRLDDKSPEFRCGECSQKRTKVLRDRGVQI